MNFSHMKAVVIGATGATGRALVQQLTDHPSINEVTVLVRKISDQLPSCVKQVVVQFDQLENWSSEIQGDMAFSCLGTTLRDAGSKEAQYTIDYEYQYRFAQLASANQIPCFCLVSSVNASMKSPFFYTRMKGELEHAIELLPFASTLIFRPGPLIRPNSNRTGEKLSVSLIGFLNKLGLFTKMAPLKVQDLATLMINKALTSPNGITIVEPHQIATELKSLYQ